MVNAVLTPRKSQRTLSKNLSTVHVPESVPPHDTPVATVTCKHYPDEGGGHEGDNADRCANGEAPQVGYEAHRVHQDNGEDNHELVGEEHTDPVPELANSDSVTEEDNQELVGEKQTDPVPELRNRDTVPGENNHELVGDDIFDEQTDPVPGVTHSDTVPEVVYDVGEDAVYVGQDGHGEAGVRQVRSGGVHDDNRDHGGGVKF